MRAIKPEKVRFMASTSIAAKNIFWLRDSCQGTDFSRAKREFRVAYSLLPQAGRRPKVAATKKKEVFLTLSHSRSQYRGRFFGQQQASE